MSRNVIVRSGSRNNSAYFFRGQLIRILRWFLVVLMALYGLAETFAAGSTLAAKMGRFPDPQLALLSTIVSWPRMAIWFAAAALAFVAAVELARQNSSGAHLFGAVALIATANNAINEMSPVYARIFTMGERMFDWTMIAALYAVWLLAFIAVRRAPMGQTTAHQVGPGTAS